MEPGHEDREYPRPFHLPARDNRASMEPGHEDREYPQASDSRRATVLPQWSPVMKTGNTAPAGQLLPVRLRASMEPGHEDREYPTRLKPPERTPRSLNGARS